MDINEVIGIDVSKNINEARIHTNQKLIEFENTIKGFKALEKWVLNNVECHKSQIMFAFEHTGLYSHPLSVYFTERDIHILLYLD
jgi:transposase